MIGAGLFGFLVIFIVGLLVAQEEYKNDEN